jgi:hypothetical protein
VKGMLERQPLDRVLPLIGIGCLSEQIQIVDVLPDRAAVLVAEDEPGERSPLPLSVLGHGSESDVMGEYHAPELASMLQ